MSDNGSGPSGEWMTSELRAEFERGLQFDHLMMIVTQNQTYETLAVVKALAEVLIQKGLVTDKEMAGPLERTREEVAKLNLPRVHLAELGDKYAAGVAAEIDCAGRIELCQARCCMMRFFLTKQDLDEGVARWDYGNPYLIRQEADGYCGHWNREGGGCTIHAQRPYVCRGYDCRQDKRVWIDFEQRIPAPMPERLRRLAVGMAGAKLQAQGEMG